MDFACLATQNSSGRWLRCACSHRIGRLGAGRRGSACDETGGRTCTAYCIVFCAVRADTTRLYIKAQCAMMTANSTRMPHAWLPIQLQHATVVHRCTMTSCRACCVSSSSRCSHRLRRSDVKRTAGRETDKWARTLIVCRHGAHTLGQSHVHGYTHTHTHTHKQTNKHTHTSTHV